MMTPPSRSHWLLIRVYTSRYTHNVILDMCTYMHQIIIPKQHHLNHNHEKIYTVEKTNETEQRTTMYCHQQQCIVIYKKLFLVTKQITIQQHYNNEIIRYIIYIYTQLAIYLEGHSTSSLVNTPGE